MYQVNYTIFNFLGEWKRWICHSSLNCYTIFELFLYVSRSIIDAIQHKVNKFLWQGKKPHLGKLLAYRIQAMGGLGLLNLWNYYLAASFIQLAQWHAPSAQIPWLQFKSNSIKPHYLPSRIWSWSIWARDIAHLNSVVYQSFICGPFTRIILIWFPHPFVWPPTWTIHPFHWLLPLKLTKWIEHGIMTWKALIQEPPF